MASFIEAVLWLFASGMFLVIVVVGMLEVFGAVYNAIRFAFFERKLEKNIKFAVDKKTTKAIN